MSPSAIDAQQIAPAPTKAIPTHAPAARKTTTSFPRPLQLSGALAEFEYEDVTPNIGREYKNVDVAAWLEAPNSDALVRDLAITIAQRGVVFFRGQDNLDIGLQKSLIVRLGQLTTRPKESSLHIHPAYNASRRGGGSDDQISTISSRQHKEYYRTETALRRSNLSDWHADISFEPAPADFTALRLVQLPKTGGDTVWASGYEIYDRISPPYQKFLESLTVTFENVGFKEAADKNGFELYKEPRGHPENIGDSLTAVHPLVRTNPVTGWKSIFPVGEHVKHINDVTLEESDRLLQWFLDVLQKNHDLQLRWKWGQADLAIWDNRSVFHAATYDYEGQGERFGNRVVGVGEKPYLDPNSQSRREALGIPQSSSVF